MDIGNFIGHLMELGIRQPQRAEALAAGAAALAECFPDLAGVDAYTTLTLARHVWISTQFEERQPFTNDLLELCERRLAEAAVLR